MSKVKAVIFDMDGTLIDTRELIYSAFESVLANNGVKKTRKEIAAVTGKPVAAMYGLLAPTHDSLELERQHHDHHKGNLHLVKAYQDAHDLLNYLKEQKIKLAIFTGFDKTAHDRLKRVSINTYFESVVECTRYQKHKPDPEGIFVAMADLDISHPQEVVYVGDAPVDILSGKNAKVAVTIGVSHGFATSEELKTADSDYIVGSLKELESLFKNEIL